MTSQSSFLPPTLCSFWFPLLSTASLLPLKEGNPFNTQAGRNTHPLWIPRLPTLRPKTQPVPGGAGKVPRASSWGRGVAYLGYAQQQLQIHQESVDIPAEHSQLSPAHLEHLLWVWGCDHASLPSPQEPIAGYFHIDGQATNVGRQPQANRLAEDAGGWGRKDQGGSHCPVPACLQGPPPGRSHSRSGVCARGSCSADERSTPGRAVSSRVGNCVNYAAAQPFIPISTTDFTNTALVSEPFPHIKTVFGSPRSNLSEQRSSSQHRAGCSLEWHGSLWGCSAVFREQMGLWWRSLPRPSCHLSQVWDRPPY